MRPDRWAGPGGRGPARSTDDDRSHAMTAPADRHLLFGLLALQNGDHQPGAARARLPGLDPRQVEEPG